MPLLFGRRARVRIAGLEIDESLRLNFEVQRTVEKTQARGQLSVYNLNPEHEQRILDRGSEVRLEAGYPETVAIIYEGATQRARARRENLSRIVTVDLGDEVHKVSRLGGHYAASFVGPVPVRTIANDIIRRGLDLSPGPLEPIPERATVTDFYWGGQSASAALSRLLATVGLDWYADGSIIRINGAGVLQPDMPALTITPRNGMIDTLRRHDEDEGASVRMFLNPAVQPGARLTVEAETDRGEFKVVSAKHIGDTWDGSFYTHAELRELPEPPAPG